MNHQRHQPVRATACGPSLLVTDEVGEMEVLRQTRTKSDKTESCRWRYSRTRKRGGVGSGLGGARKTWSRVEQQNFRCLPDSAVLRFARIRRAPKDSRYLVGSVQARGQVTIALACLNCWRSRHYLGTFVATPGPAFAFEWARNSYLTRSRCVALTPASESSIVLPAAFGA